MAKRPASGSKDDDATSSGAHGGTADRHEGGEPLEMTPGAALARHIEWLEYALGAARAEETARAARLDKATKKNRDKRTNRLAEARDEVAELTALLAGIRDLQAKAHGTPPVKPSSPGRVGR
jgi:hypothetical protein